MKQSEANATKQSISANLESKANLLLYTNLNANYLLIRFWVIYSNLSFKFAWFGLLRRICDSPRNDESFFDLHSNLGFSRYNFAFKITTTKDKFWDLKYLALDFLTSRQR